MERRRSSCIYRIALAAFLLWVVLSCCISSATMLATGEAIDENESDAAFGGMLVTPALCCISLFGFFGLGFIVLVTKP